MARFFPSIDHEILLAILGRTLKDDKVVRLIGRILENGLGILDTPPVWFPGDGLLGPLRPKALPLGNMTSQFWANVYLNELDQHVKRVMKVKAYLRYADDSLLFASDKEQLRTWKTEVIERLASLRLSPKPGSFQVYPVRHGIEFLGFRVYPDHRRLLAHNVSKARLRLRRLSFLYRQGLVSVREVSASVQAWVAHARHGDTWGLRRSVLREFQGIRDHERIPDIREN